MRFEELEKKHKDLLISSLLWHIEERAEYEDVVDFIEPTYEEYKDLFNELDEGYRIVDGYPESMARNMLSIIFCESKVELKVEDPYEYGY